MVLKFDSGGVSVLDSSSLRFLFSRCTCIVLIQSYEKRLWQWRMKMEKGRDFVRPPRSTAVGPWFHLFGFGAKTTLNTLNYDICV